MSVDDKGRPDTSSYGSPNGPEAAVRSRIGRHSPVREIRRYVVVEQPVSPSPKDAPRHPRGLQAGEEIRRLMAALVGGVHRTCLGTALQGGYVAE